jgi:lysozyme
MSSTIIVRSATDRGLDLIKKFEGFSSVPYRCPGGHMTIGYGHVIRAGENLDLVDEAEAEELLKKDVEHAERAVLRLIDVPLVGCQFDALVSFAYNVGTGALQRSTLRRRVNRGEHGAVPRELLRWVWSGGRRLSGLVRRRNAEGELYSDLYRQ